MRAAPKRVSRSGLKIQNLYTEKDVDDSDIDNSESELEEEEGSEEDVLSQSD